MTRPLVKFLSLTFAATWTCWAAAFAISSGVIAGMLTFLGTIAPALVALALTDRAEGHEAAGMLLRRVFKWNVGARWYVFAIAYIPAVKLSVALIYRLATGAWPRFGQVPWYVMAMAVLISTWVQSGEEIGWRGFALPHLTDRFGLAPASVILGIIWAVWHLPLFFFPQSDTFGQSFPLFLVQVTALSVAMAWLYWRTQGSLLLVMLLHAAVNNTKDIVPSAAPGATNAFALSASLVAWLTVTLLWMIAGVFLAQMRKITPGSAGVSPATFSSSRPPFDGW